MKYLKYSATLFMAGILTIGLSTQALAQSDNYSKAVAAFNKALEQAKANEFESAINMYNQAVSLAEESDNEKAGDLVDRAQSQLPSIYFQLAVTKYKAFQQSQNIAGLEEAMTAFQEAADISEEYGNGQVAQKASNIVTQLLYTRSIIEFKSQQYDAAIASLDEAIERNPNYAKAYYQKGLVIKNQNDEDLDIALEMFDQAIEVGKQVNDNQIVRQATEAGRDNLIYRGVQNMEDKNFARAEEQLNRALEYDAESANAHYRLAELHNKQTNWDQAISHAQKALDLETGGKTELAKIYFELGTALKAQGRKAEACSAFKNAAFGSFQSPAEHEIEFELECESST
ncbi:tetratricopeptide repeat protein [Halalkalibaculum sp. DA3122]|uniref:tetratricopeptide repeat protein n=1 Tax=Halalkalibaculum sp. DA3122 TaxID=3373607 RepID=UPI0037548C60